MEILRTLNGGKLLLSRITNTHAIVREFSQSSSRARNTVKPIGSRKTFLIDKYKDLMERNSAVLFVHYNNLNQNEDRFYREQVRLTGGTLTKLRNSVFEVYLRNSNRPDPAARVYHKSRRSYLRGRSHPLAPLLSGPTAAITYRDSDPRALAKLIRLLGPQSQDKLFLLGARIEGYVMHVDELKTYATLPTLSSLQAQLVATLESPAASITRSLETTQIQLCNDLSRRPDTTVER